MTYLAFFDDKVSAYIGRPREIWENLIYIGMSKKTLNLNFIAVASKSTLTSHSYLPQKIYFICFNEIPLKMGKWWKCFLLHVKSLFHSQDRYLNFCLEFMVI